MPPTWLIIVAVVLFIVGAVLLGYGLVKHEDKNEKTTTHKLLIGVGVLFILFGVAIILWAIISKFSQKPKAPAPQPEVMAPKPMMPRPGYASTPVYQPNLMYQPNPGMDFNTGQMMYSNSMNYPTVQQQQPYPGQNYMGQY